MLLCARRNATDPSRPLLWMPGAEWWLDIPAAERARIHEAVRALPLAIEVETERGTVGVIHGDVPPGMDWSTFCAALKSGDRGAVDTALWGRDRIQGRVNAGVPGIGRLFVGHTPQWEGVLRLGNVYAVDTGAVFTDLGGRLTLINIRLGSADALVPRPAVRVDTRDDPNTPARPFGSHVGRTSVPGRQCERLA